MTRCVFSRLADDDLEAIGDYIAHDNPRRALSLRREVHDRCQAIVQYPQAVPLRPELRQRAMRMVVFRDYLIFYRHSRGARLIIERVLHGARDIRMACSK